MFSRSGTRLWLMAGVLAVLCLDIGLGLAQEAEGLIQDRVAIQGLWTRVDAPYLLEFGYGEDGLLQGAYFNPHPINVASTQIVEDEGLLYIQVILQDVKYEGSTYTLVYERQKDMLYGTYLHGGTGNLYEVEFVRKPEEEQDK